MVVLLASTLFLVQNDYYNWVLERSRTQDNARSATELVAEDIRSLTAGGVIVADSTRLVFRRPLAVGMICDKFGSYHGVHLPGGIAGVDVGDVSGFGVRSSAGSWTYEDASWYQIYLTASFAAWLCSGEGADTVGGYAEFLLFRDLEDMAGVNTSIGDAIMLYQDLELSFAPSSLDSTTWALYRGTYGDTLVEFATGFATSAHFSYRTGDTSHVASVASGSLADVDGVRVHALTEAQITSVVRSDVTFDMVTDLLLRNGG